MSLDAGRTIFTAKEIRVLKLKIDGMMNRQIARKLGVSEEDISQTLSRIRGKIRKVEDSVHLFESLKIIERAPRFGLSEEGKQLIASRRAARRKMWTPVIFEKEPTMGDNVLGTAYAQMTDLLTTTYLDFGMGMRIDRMYGEIYQKKTLKRRGLGRPFEEILEA